ncbi:MAG: serine/threonine protein kinase [Myxococcales bacterium]|nr:serine/threonine protein kinase [Myxococcales bacterium]
MSAQPHSDDAPHPLIGQGVGKYKITRVVGVGGMGTVFEAQHETLNQRVAIKVMHAKLMADKDSLRRFLNEAKTTSLVHHVGLVRVFDYGQLEDSSAYMMMEYLEGESLRARLAKVEKLGVGDALRVTRQIAAALAAAHDKNVVHRDLKPENVLMVPDPETPSGERAKVLDFGIAKVMEPEGDGQVLKTTTGAIIGTPTYMSPEQCRGIGQTSDRSDVYSLGCMLYQMLSGRPPFTGDGSGDLIAKHIVEKPQPLRELVPTVGPEIETLVHSMLEKKPESRPSMRQVLQSLEQLGQHSTASGAGSVVIVTPPDAVGRNESTKPAGKPRSKLPLIVLGVALLVAAIVVVGLNRSPGQRPQTGGGTGTGTATSSPEKPAPSQVTLSIDSEPRGAQILSAAEQRVLGSTPWRQERARGQGHVELLIRLSGYHDQKVVFDGSMDDSRLVKLIAIPPPPTEKPEVKPVVDPKKPQPIKRIGKPIGRPGGQPSGPTKKNNDDDDVPVAR